MKTVLYFRFLWRLCPRSIGGIYRYARKAGWRVQVIEGGRNTPSAKRAISGWHADGCIVDWNFLDRLGWTPRVFGDLPTVYIDAPSVRMRKPYSGVQDDSACCARLATEELLSLDYADYAYVGFMEKTGWSDRRREVFEETVAAAGKRVHLFKPDLSGGIDAFYESMRPWVRALPKPCGVFAANDKVADLVLHACRIEGVKVPESIAVIGVDDDETICENAEPTLTSVRPDFEGAGYMAAELLGELMADPSREPEVRIYGGAKVVRRNSTRVFERCDKAIRDAVEYVRLNACRGVRPADILKRIGGGRRTAEIRFRAFAGRSIGAEIAAVRLERAKELLSRPQTPIESIHAECGFADPASLRRAFLAATGQSLSAWRSAHSAR